MTPPARRDGTPDKKQRDSDIIVSNAKPARHQHVSKKKQKATAESVARELGADWLVDEDKPCLLYTSPSPRDQRGSRMPSSA